MPSGGTRVVWRPTFVINHPDNGPRDSEYKTTQYFSCKTCKERFGVNIVLRGLSKERYDRYLKKETLNLATTGGIDYKPAYDISQEFSQTMKGLCPECLADAADRFLNENNTSTS